MRTVPPGGRRLVGGVFGVVASTAAVAQTNFNLAEPLVLDAGFNASPTAIDAGDLDEDGFADLVVSGRNTEGAVIFWGQAGGSFAPPVLLPLPGQSDWTVVEDLDGDDHQDLVFSIRSGLGSLSLVFGDGTRDLPEPLEVPAGRLPNLVRRADVDDDGDADLIVTNWGTSDVRILTNDGAGGFRETQRIAMDRTVPGSVTPSWGRLGDLDGDSDLDIAVVSIQAKPVVHLLFNQGGGVFAPAVQQAIAGIGDDEAVATLAVADVDADGDPDLVTKAGGIDFLDRFIVLANDGAGFFTPAAEVPLDVNAGGSPWDVAAGDFDDDGHDDLAWVTHALSTQRVAFLRNDGAGGATFAKPEQTFFLGGFPRMVRPVDLDGDGDLDILVANQADDTAVVLENLTVSAARAQRPRVAAAPSAAPRAAGIREARRALEDLAEWRSAAASGPCGDPEAGDCFEPNDSPACADEACCLLVCDALPLCCLNPWDQTCVDAAFDLCEEPPVCPAEGSCFAAHDNPGCDDQACCELICLVDAYCCDGPWDQLCAEQAGLLCGGSPCALGECPAGAVVEAETIDCFDRANDGCNVKPPAFASLACGDTVCGTTWTSGGNRDTDWYTVTVEEPTELTWTVTSEFPSEVFIVSGECAGQLTVAASGFGGGCVPASTTLSVEPGTYALFVAAGTEAAAVRGGIGCLADGEPTGGGAFTGGYEATVTCAPPCPADIDGDGVVGVVDFLALLAAWGTDPGGPPDLDGDGTVGVVDFLALLAAWGACGMSVHEVHGSFSSTLYFLLSPAASPRATPHRQESRE